MIPATNLINECEIFENEKKNLHAKWAHNSNLLVSTYLSIGSTLGNLI